MSGKYKLHKNLKYKKEKKGPGKSNSKSG